MKTYTCSPESRWDEQAPTPTPAPSGHESPPKGAATPPPAGIPLALRDRALDFIAEGVVVVDLLQPYYPITYVNPAFEHLTGYPAAELIGRPYDILQGAHGDLVTFAAIQAALRDRRTWSGEVCVCRKDGTYTWQELRLTVLPDAAGQGRHALGIQVDLTERKNLQEGLRQAQKMAAIGWLAGGLAHDFNNLLTPILGYCDMLLADPSPVFLREALEEIRKAGECGTTLIGQLLALCRKQQPQAQVLDPRTLLANLQGLLRCLLPKNVVLITSVDPALGRIQAGPGQVEQILLNLVRNACDAMPQGGTITLTLANAELTGGSGPGADEIPPGPYVLLTVTDTGGGMTEEVRAGLFQPLFTTKNFGKGHGLGLFMVQGIVKQNHGLVRVVSQPNQGARVEIYWPRISDAIAHREPLPRRGGETILLVDDEPEVREVMRWVLQQEGYTVLEARDGREAIRIGREHPGPIHLLLTDMVMPRMDAHELVAHLAPQRSEMKVLYLSGYGSQEEGDFLPKPFTPEILIRKVRAVLDRANG